MDMQERGVAVALSLGGKAQRIAESMDPNILNRPDGLYQLLRQLHYYLGAEAQDKQRHSYRAFERYRRNKGTSAAEHILEFERLYSEIVAHGMFLPRITLSMKLLESAGLSDQQESWILQTVAADYSRYNEIRLALKRLPSLDHRHQDSGHYPVDNMPRQPGYHQPHAQGFQSYQPFSNNGQLNRPPPDPAPPYQQPEFDNSASPADQYEEDDSDSDDDYCSSAPSDISQEHEADLMAQAFAVLRRKQSSYHKRTGKRFYRKGFSRGRKTWLVDTKRNYSDTVPTGWDKAKWLKRSPCPDCGSRFHRTCKNQNATKTYPAFKKKSRVQKGKGKGVGTWATFMLTAASLLQPAMSYAGIQNVVEMQCFPCTTYHSHHEQSKSFCLDVVTDLPTWNVVEPTSQMFYSDSSFEESCTEMFYDCVEEECELNDPDCLTQVPAQISNDLRVFHVYHLRTFLDEQNESNTYHGLEPYDSVYRVKRYEQLQHSAKARLRFALMLDTGAPSSCIGRRYLKRFINEFHLEASMHYLPYNAQLSGIGAGSATVTQKAVVPIGMCSANASEEDTHAMQGTWTTQVLDGIGEGVPPLLGLDSMCANKTIINLDKTPPEMSCMTPTGRRSFTLDIVGGHLMLPIDWGGKPLPDRQTFYYDTLGTHASFINDSTDDDKTTDTQPNTDLRFVTSEPPHFETPAQEPVFHGPSQAGPPSEDQTKAFATFTQGSVFHASASRNRSTQHANVTTTQTIHRNTLLQQRDNDLHTTKKDNLPKTVPITQQHKTETRASTKRKKDLNSPKFSRFAESQQPNGTYHNETKNQTINTRPGHNMKSKQLTKDEQEFLLGNNTYRKKYRPFPSDTPLPITEGIQRGQWDVWEWWSGTGKFTRSCKKRGLLVGPPISHETGWDLLLPEHRARLRELFLLHRPKFLMGAPLCSPWSISNTTMCLMTKELIRKQQLQAFEFFTELCEVQHREGRSFGIEQPQGSTLLITQAGLKLLQLGTVDSVCHMCQHNLTDRTNHKPIMKPTVLRATSGVITNHTARLCPRDHEHQLLQGRAPGKNCLRTELAQEYTDLFCSRFSADVKQYLRGNKPQTRAFPIDDEQVSVSSGSNQAAEADPYPEVEEDISPLGEEARIQKAIEEAKARRQANPTSPMPSTPKPPENPLPQAKQLAKSPNTPASSSKPSIIPPGLGEPASPADALRQPEETISPDPLAPPEMTETANPQRRRTTDKDSEDMLTQLIQQRSRLMPGNAFTIGVPGKLKVFQEIFGTPHGKTIKLAVISHKPQGPASPEPMVSRLIVNLSMTIAQDSKNGSWTRGPWGEYKVEQQKYKRRPEWECTLFGHTTKADDLAEQALATPLDTVAEQQELAVQNTTSLSGVLKILCEANDTEKQIQVLLNLHKRLYHRKAEELSTLLTRAGIPSKCLIRVKEAVERCEYCRRWAQVAAKPSIKTRISSRFNELVYADIVYLDSPPTLHFVCVDDSIRVTTVWYIEFRDFRTLEQAFRQSWIRRFGPPVRLRSDREGALSAEQFAVFCEKMNISLELVTAGEHHGYLGPLDRRIKIIRLHAPILLDLLSEDCIQIDHADLSAELELDLNTSLSYAGVTPYQCLYGMLPRPIFNDEMEGLSAYSDAEPFFEMQQIRLRSAQAFQQALLRYRVKKATTARPRKEAQQAYKVGDTVDIWRRPKHRDLQGWRGPAVVIQLLGEGMLCVRWQSMVIDLPVHHARPHINVSSTAALPPTKKNAFQKWIDTHAPDDETRVQREMKDVSELDSKLDEASMFTFFTKEHNTWELFYNEEIADQLKEDHACLDTLTSMTASMPNGTIQIHSVTLNKAGTLSLSREATRDNRCIWKVAEQLARLFSLKNYMGVALLNGRRHISVLQGVHELYMLVWTNSVDDIQQITASGNQMIDFVLLGYSLEHIMDLKCISLLCAPPSEEVMLKQLLERIPEENLTEDTGRFREELKDNPSIENVELASTVVVPRAESNATTRWDDSFSQSDIMAMQTRGITPWELQCELQSQQRYYNKVKDNRHHVNQHDFNESLVGSCGTLDQVAVNSYNMPNVYMPQIKMSNECFFVFDDYDHAAYYPLDKDTRPLVEEELQLHAAEIEIAMLKELTSWVQHSTGRPIRKKDYERESKLRGLPSRWVIEFKRKEGQRIIKARLCIKGYAEQNQGDLQTRSPTASRTGHRVVHQVSATNKWTLASLDISTAFLQGFKFDDLPTGISRQRCAFSPPNGVYQLLAKIDPIWKEAASAPGDFLYELHKSAYGLKDAPLMWFIAINAFLKEHNTVSTSHDACVYKHWNASKELDLLLSLHVDDTLVTGREQDVDKFASVLEAKFGKISYQKGSFTHFGIETVQCHKTHNVSLCQRNYLKQIKPIDINAKRGSGRVAETKANAEEVTQFRSVISAIAWLSQTFPPAGTAASLYQSRLPEPTLGDLRQLNSLLEQLNEVYTPLTIRGDVDFRSCLIISLADASLGNASKHSQVGYIIALAQRLGDELTFNWSIMTYKSQKSKRVATSTMHSELLAQSTAAEEAVNLQTFLFELGNPTYSTNDLLQVPASSLCPIWSITGCNDLYDVLVKSTQPVLTNKSMTLFVEALREYKREGRIREFCWCDTRDNVSNVLTKLKSDGSLDTEGVLEALSTATWTLKHVFKIGNVSFLPN